MEQVILAVTPLQREMLVILFTGQSSDVSAGLTVRLLRAIKRLFGAVTGDEHRRTIKVSSTFSLRLQLPQFNTFPLYEFSTKTLLW